MLVDSFVINLQPCVQRVHSYFNYRWLIWEFRKYYYHCVVLLYKLNYKEKCLDNNIIFF